MSSQIRGFVLDWAGTTVDYGCQAPVRSLCVAFEQYGVAISTAEARAPMGLGKLEHTRAILAMESVQQRFQEAKGRLPEESDVTQIYAAVEEHLLEQVCLHTDVIPGVREFVEWARARQLPIGSSTGYTEQMMQRLIPKAHANGYAPDYLVTPNHVPAGRPYPWMCYLNAMQLGMYPLSQLVKIGDTVADVQEGRNAGMWTIALVECGNELGLTKQEKAGCPAAELQAKILVAEDRLRQAGAHYVLADWSQVEETLSEIEERLGNGENPAARRVA